MDNMALFALLLFAVIIGVIISIIAISATNNDKKQQFFQKIMRLNTMSVSRQLAVSHLHGASILL